jgi:lipopolysaccharide transport system ATP-binding protein
LSRHFDAAIRVDNLSKCYQIYARPEHRLLQSLFRGKRQYFREFWALHDVSFEVRKGETVGIIGRNGSGKSTLLQMICGTLAPSSGELKLNGKVAALLELGAGFNPEFTGKENVYMNASILGLSQAEIDARYRDIAEFADIGDFINQPVKTYSSGMFVRLAFAVIAHVDADILVIDEALAVGDAFFTQKCMRFLRKFKESGTVLFVSHDTAAVVNLCQRAVWLEAGRIRMHGSAKEVSEAYLEAVYEAQQGASAVPKGAGARPPAADPDRPKAGRRPQAAAPAHIEIEQFSFDPDKPAFGAGGASIVAVQLRDAREQESAKWIAGGESVVVSVHCKAERDIARPIIGFYVRDRLGQILFGDNTYLSYLENPVRIKPGQEIEARFEFAMPLLPTGDYSICAAIAEGTQTDHVQYHWMHDALIFRVNASPAQCGLVGIPMDSISLRMKPE